MTKIDYEAGKKAVGEIIKNSAKVENILSTISELNKNLDEATKEYNELSSNLAKIETKLSNNFNKQFENLSKDFNKSIEVNLAQSLSEVSVRLRDLKDQQANSELALENLSDKFETKLKKLRFFILFWGAVFCAVTVGTVMYLAGITL